MSHNNTTTLVNVLSKMSLNDRIAYYADTNRLPTDTKNIYLNNLNCYTSLPMSEGNSKLDNSIMIFDLLAVVSCLNCKSCASTCYALKAQRQYSNVLLKRSLNTYLAKHDIDQLEYLIMSQLHKTSKKIVRIHSSGDFLSQHYINMWTNIAVSYPKIKFYTYTKVENIFDFSRFESLNNVNIVRSILPNGKVNYGSDEYIIAMAQEFNAPVCEYRKGMPKESIPHCGKTCFKCMNSQYVLFHQH